MFFFCNRRYTNSRYKFEKIRDDDRHKSFILDDVKLAELSNNSFEWKNVTFLGSKHTLALPTYFQGVRTPNPYDLRPCVNAVVAMTIYQNIYLSHAQTGKRMSWSLERIHKTLRKSFKITQKHTLLHFRILPGHDSRVGNKSTAAAAARTATNVLVSVFSHVSFHHLKFV